MIPAGRTAVDITGIAELHGLSPRQARTQRPWDMPGHPAPLTRGRPRRGHPRLWDHDQAAAHATGQPVPALPEPGNPLDLLDLAEAAELAEMTSKTWARYQSYDHTRAANTPPLVPPPDQVVCGTPHWYRRTVEHYRADRANRAGQPRGGRPPGAVDRVARGQISARVAELLDEANRTGTTLTAAEVARRLNINYKTALTHLRGHTDAPPAEG
jgi:hypothetical protein